jgi:hypothetical protein
MYCYVHFRDTHHCYQRMPDERYQHRRCFVSRGCEMLVDWYGCRLQIRPAVVGEREYDRDLVLSRQFIQLPIRPERLFCE